MSEQNPQYDGSGWIDRIKPSGECMRGIQPKNLGTVISGRASSRKITTGRKSFRGSAADDFAARENRGQA